MNCIAPPPPPPICRLTSWVTALTTATTNARKAYNDNPPPWVTYSPLLPLALLLLTGLYMFVLPYAGKWRSGRRSDSTA